MMSSNSNPRDSLGGALSIKRTADPMEVSKAEPIFVYKTKPNKKRNKKLDRRRGLAWEDELTTQINNSDKIGDAYNLGGATTYIPDIMLFSNYVYDKDKDMRQYRLDLPTVNKFYTNHSITSIECKFTTFDEIKIPKEDIDKGFEFIQRLDKYERFIVLAVKFQTSKMKSRKFFIIMKWDYTFIRADYTHLHIKINGDYSFVKTHGRGHKSEVCAELNNKYFDHKNFKTAWGEFKIEEI
jgi:hypothetical protein